MIDGNSQNLETFVRSSLGLTECFSSAVSDCTTGRDGSLLYECLLHEVLFVCYEAKPRLRLLFPYFESF